MQFSSLHIQEMLKKDSGFTILRSRSAPLVLSFLYKTYRETNIPLVASDELEEMLVHFLQEHKDEEKDLQSEIEEGDFVRQSLELTSLQSRSHAYISLWCSDEKQYLRRYHNQKGIPVVELSAGLERVFNYLESVEQAQNQEAFVGTESRFQSILLQLRDLKQNINEDPETRIAELKKQRNAINSQIKEIQETGIVQTYTPIQIQERLTEISRASRELLSDFRQIEANFRYIMQGIYKKQSESDSSRGTILGYTLDTDSKLRSSPQGQSFSTFWNFISQDTGDEINELANSITSTSPDEFLPSLKKYLYNAGHKIIEQNRTLTDRINRILQQQTASERRQIASLTADIKKEMHLYKENVEAKKIAPASENFMQIQTRPSLNFPQRFYPVPFVKEKDFGNVIQFEENTFNPLAFTELFNQFYIDEKLLQTHLREFKNRNAGKQFTLATLIDQYPIEKGLSELIAWFAIATKEKSAVIDTDTTDTISYQKDGEVVQVKVPRVIFG